MSMPTPRSPSLRPRSQHAGQFSLSVARAGTVGGGGFVLTSGRGRSCTGGRPETGGKESASCIVSCDSVLEKKRMAAG
jgi:hypothetical protein